MKRIVSVVLISALLLTGCRQTPENSADSKLYVSINGENLQGIKEVVQKKNVDLENMGPVNIKINIAQSTSLKMSNNEPYAGKTCSCYT